MIREDDLDEAIASCQGERNPTASTCIKLAAFYNLKEHLFPAPNNAQIAPSVRFPEADRYSYASGEQTIETAIDSEFCDAIRGKTVSEVLPILNELMETLKVINPKLYNVALSKF